MQARSMVLAGAVASMSTAPNAGSMAETLPWGAAMRNDVRLLWCDPLDARPVDAEWVAAEVDRLFAPLGLRLAWRSASHCEPSPDEVTVIILLRDRARRDPSNTVMGAAMLSGDLKAWVFVEAVARTIGLPPETEALRSSERLRLARAVARVAAHEIVHLPAPSVGHGAGLMAARLRETALTARGARFDALVGRALRASGGRARPAGRRVGARAGGRHGGVRAGRPRARGGVRLSRAARTRTRTAGP